MCRTVKPHVTDDSKKRARTVKPPETQDSKKQEETCKEVKQTNKQTNNWSI